MEKLVGMGGVGEDEMKGKHVLLTTYRVVVLGNLRAKTACLW